MSNILSTVNLDEPQILAGSAGPDSLKGGTGNDSLYGFDGDDSLYGQDGNDVLEGSWGANLLDGGDGDDSLSTYDASTLIGGNGNDYLYGPGMLDGGNGNDYLTGSGTLIGGQGNDSLIGQYFADSTFIFNLGDGQDTLSYFSFDDPQLDQSKLVFGAGILPAQISFAASTEPSGLVLVINEQDRITLAGWTPDSTLGLKRLVFADGTEWTRQTLNEKFLASPASQLNLKGSADADLLTGFFGNDQLHGNAGNDTLNGGLGNDSLYGGDGDDVLADYEGNNLLDGGSGNDYLSGVGSLTGGTGDDTLNGYGTLTGGQGNDVIEYSSFADSSFKFNLGDGQDTLSYYNLLDSQTGIRTLIFGKDIKPAQIRFETHPSLNGLVLVLNEQDRITLANWNSQNPVLQRLVFADGTEWSAETLTEKFLASPIGQQTFEGTADNDSLDGSIGNDRLYGRDGDDSLFDVQGDNLLDGGNGNDYLSGSGTLIGGAGDDILYGAGTLDGGDGNDYLSGSGSLTGGDGNDTLSADSGINNLLDGGAGDDSITGFGTLSGGDGNDTLSAAYDIDSLLDGGAGDDWIAGPGTIIGGTGNDSLYGSYYSPTRFEFNLGDGQDTLFASPSYFSNQLVFGEGIDPEQLKFAIDSEQNGLVLIINSQDRITLESWDPSGNSGIQSVLFADGTEWSFETLQAEFLALSNAPLRLEGTDVADQLFGQNGNDTLLGGDGNDWLDGGQGNDSLQGDDGDDHLEGNNGNDLLQGGDGDDYLRGGDDDDTVAGGAGNDTLTGDYGNDLLRGGDGKDLLEDYQGNNLLQGGAGDDTLTGTGLLAGGTGNDLLNGNGGSTSFLFNLGDGQDTLTFWNLEPQSFSRVILGAGLDPAQVSIEINAELQALVLVFNANDRLLLTDWNPSNTPSYALQLLFADGTVWSQSTLQEKFLASPLSQLQIDGTAEADSLHGFFGNDRLNGLAGNDSLNGGVGNDSLFGGDGDDRLVDYLGDNLLDGGNGNDWLEGSGSLTGGAGNDSLSGTGTLVGGTGNDLLAVNNGPIDMLFNLGDGQDSLLAYNSSGPEGTNRLIFGAGISPDQITFAADAEGELVLVINDQDRITLLNWTLDLGYGVQQLIFADGTEWSSDTLKDKVLASPLNQLDLEGTDGADQLAGFIGNDRLSGGKGDDSLSGSKGDDSLSGGDGNDLLYGGDGNDTLDGGQGNDTLWGGAGTNSILFGRDSGQDQLLLDSWSSGDQILLAADLKPEDLLLQQENWDLRLSIRNTGDSLLISDFFLQGGSGSYSPIAPLQFSDGSQLDLTYLDLRLNGTSGNDQLSSDAPGQRLEGGAGQDYLDSVYQDSYLDGGAGDDFLNGPGTLVGGAGDDLLYGAGTLIGGVGNDTLTALGGATLVFNLGDGQDQLHYSYVYSETPQQRPLLQFGAGISAEQLKLSLSEDLTGLIIQVSDTDSIQLIGLPLSTDKVLEFADGSHWTGQHIRELLATSTDGDDRLYGFDLEPANLHGLDGNDSLYGSSGDDSLYGDAGNDSLDGSWGQDLLVDSVGQNTLNGGHGNDSLQGTGTFIGGEGDDSLSGEGKGQDSYLFRLQDGHDTLQDDGGADTLKFGQGISVNHIRFEQANNALLIKVGNDSSLTINDWFKGADHQIERIEFADGRVWDLAAINARLPVTIQDSAKTLLEGQHGNDHLQGGKTDDKLDGKAGNDRLSGQDGNDSLYGGQGQDWLDGGAGNDSLDGGQGNDVLKGGAGNDLLFDKIGYNRLDGGAGDDTLTGQGMFSGGQGNDRLVASNKLSGDTYLFNRGDGQDTLIELGLNSVLALPMLGQTDDLLLFGDIKADQLWFLKNGNDLEVQVIGTTDSIRIQDWYQGANHQVELFSTADGQVLLSTQVDALVSAMAAFAPPAAGTSSLPEAQQAVLNPVIAANWN